MTKADKNVVVIGGDSIATRLCVFLRKIRPRLNITLIPFPWQSIGLIRELVLNIPQFSRRVSWSSLKNYDEKYLSKIARINIVRFLQPEVLEQAETEDSTIFISNRGRLKVYFSHSEKTLYPEKTEDLISLLEEIRTLKRKTSEKPVIGGSLPVLTPFLKLLSRMKVEYTVSIDALKEFFEEDILEHVNTTGFFFSYEKPDVIIEIEKPELTSYGIDKCEVNFNMQYNENIYMFGELVKAPEVVSGRKFIFMNPSIVEKQAYTALMHFIQKVSPARGFLNYINLSLPRCHLVSIGPFPSLLRDKYYLTSTKVSFNEGKGVIKITGERKEGLLLNVQLASSDPPEFNVSMLYPLMALKTPLLESYCFILQKLHKAFEEDPLLNGLTALIRKIYF